MLQFSEVKKFNLVIIGEVIGCAGFWWSWTICMLQFSEVNKFKPVFIGGGLLDVQFSGENKNDVMVFGEVIQYVCCNLVRLTNLNRLLLLRLDVLFSGAVKKWYPGIWWG